MACRLAGSKWEAGDGLGSQKTPVTKKQKLTREKVRQYLIDCQLRVKQTKIWQDVSGAG